MFREQDVVCILLQRCIHSTQHFYTFLPVSQHTHSHICSLPSSNRFCIPFIHSKHDSISDQANSYLFSLIQFNLSVRFFILPEALLTYLHTLASENVDYAFINHSQAFFTICDARGNSLTSRETDFYLCLLFLHDFNSQSAMSSFSFTHSLIAGQSFITVDSFLASPSFFSMSSITNAQDIREKGTIPQEVQISDLFKSCFLYTLFNSIRNDYPVNYSELQRFLTGDSCATGTILVDVSPLLRVLPVLTPMEIQSLDETIVGVIDSMNCLMFQEWLIVRCESYPTFIRMDLIHSKRSSTSNEVGCFSVISEIVSKSSFLFNDESMFLLFLVVSMCEESLYSSFIQTLFLLSP